MLITTEADVIACFVCLFWQMLLPIGLWQMLMPLITLRLMLLPVVLLFLLTDVIVNMYGGYFVHLL